jgi:ribose transport system ATP-binding protein
MVTEDHQGAPLLTASGVVKHFPGAKALDGVDLDVYPGEVHCLLGQNGAGKSTLIKVLAGAHKPDAGVITWQGQEVSFATPIAALRAGIATMYQELDVVDGLTVAENIFLGNEVSVGGFTHRTSAHTRTREMLKRLGHSNISPNTEVEELSAAGKQVVSMARALSHDAKLIIMDEPSTALTEQELTRVFATIRELVKDGRSILYVSHRLQEVMEIGHRATIMRDGRTVQEVEVSQVKEQDLVMAMVGQHRSLIERLARKSVPKEVAFQVDSLEGPEGVQVKDFTVRVGEIVGLAGLNGSGRTTFLRIIFGDL